MKSIERVDLIDVTVRIPRNIIERVVTAGGPDQNSLERLGLAKVILEDRRRRSAIFPRVKFGEASWDMILELYTARHCGRQLDLTRLYKASGTPIATACRHVERLVACGYMVREPDPKDGQRTFVLATDALCLAVEEWLDLHMNALPLC
jgi:DNA-binding MarR family transcriptional regulator